MTTSAASQRKANFDWVFFFTIAAIGLFLRARRLWNRELWLDETEQISGLSRPLWDVLTGYLPGIPGGFPGDYVLTWPLIQTSHQKWIVNLPHIAATIVGFWFFYLICRRYLKSTAGRLLAYGFFAFNSNLIFHAFELRPYAVLPVLALGIFGITGQVVREKEIRFAWVVLWGIGVILTLWFHVYGVVMIFISLTYHLLFSRSDEPISATGKRLAWPFIFAGVVAMPVWLYYFRAAVGTTYAVDPFQFSGSGFKAIVSFVIGNLTALPVPAHTTLAAGLVGLGLLIKDDTRINRWVLAGLIALPIALIALSDIRSGYWFLQRQFVWVMPFWAILAGQSLESILYKARSLRT